MEHLPFAVQAIIWAISIGFVLMLILINFAAIFRIGRPEFIWFDMWVGFFWDTKKRLLYVAPLPCIVFIYHFPRHQKGLTLGKPSAPEDQPTKGYVDGLEEDWHEGK